MAKDLIKKKAPRRERMKKHTDYVLKEIVKSGSLSSAAAQYELDRRSKRNA